MLATEVDLLYRLVPDWKQQGWNKDDPGHVYVGAFCFQFWLFGVWTEVVVDDLLPTADGKLIYAHSGERKNVFWGALLEKAYAKVHASYEALVAGSIGDALVDFTGGICENIELKEMSKEDLKKFFKTLVKASDRKSLMGCYIGALETFREKQTTTGLVMGHAYSVTDVRRVHVKGLSFKKYKLVRVRNPWGEKSWTGAWSDTSDEWNKISKHDRQKANLTVADVGEFWMSLDDFVKNFSNIVICRKLNTSHLSVHKTWRHQSARGEWKRGAMCGGCINYKDTFLTKNYQYKMTLTEPGVVLVSLMQKDARIKRREGGGNLSVGFAILKCEENRKYRMNQTTRVAAQVTYLNSRELFGRFELEAGAYLVVPSTFEPNQESEFLLRIFSEEHIDLHPLERVKPRKHFLRKYPVGVLRLQTIASAGLAKQDVFGKGANPYCIVKVGRFSTRSPIIQNSLEPKFNTYFTFFVKRPKKEKITVQVWNHGLTYDRFMGQVVLDVAEYAAPSKNGKSWQLMSQLKPRPGCGSSEEDSLKYSGSLALEISYKDDLIGF